MQTIYEICQSVRQPGEGKATKKSPPITEGLNPRKPPLKEGLVQLTPEQILSIRVEPVCMNGKVMGYQRDLNLWHARKIAATYRRGGNVPEVTLALDSGYLYAPDGQHRLVGAVIAKKPVWAVIRKMDEKERSERFAGQRLAIRPSADVIVLAGNDAISTYLKSAVEAEANGVGHAWAGIVGMKADAKHIGAGTAYALIAAYALNTLGSSSAARMVGTMTPGELRERFNEELGDELASLLLAFGTKQTAHASVYRPAALKALVDVAIVAVRRNPKWEQAIGRWERHMVTFDWNANAWATRFPEIRGRLLDHWNKRLPASSKVSF